MSKSAHVKRYSSAFKLKVVEEIEQGKLSISEARKLYDIKGGGTIRSWLRGHGRNHLLNKVVRIEMADEVSRIRELEKAKQTLESALAQTQLKVLALEALLKAAEEELGIDIKKNFDTKGLKSCEKR